MNLGQFTTALGTTAAISISGSTLANDTQQVTEQIFRLRNGGGNIAQYIDASERLICQSGVFNPSITEPLNQLIGDHCINKVRGILGYPPIMPKIRPNSSQGYNAPYPYSSNNIQPNTQYKGPSGYSASPYVPGRSCIPLSSTPFLQGKNGTFPGTAIKGYWCQ